MIVASRIDIIVAAIPDIAALTAVYTGIAGVSGILIVYTIIISA
jgi:hypothetical protein